MAYVYLSKLLVSGRIVTCPILLLFSPQVDEDDPDTNSFSLEFPGPEGTIFGWNGANVFLADP